MPRPSMPAPRLTAVLRLQRVTGSSRPIAVYRSFSTRTFASILLTTDHQGVLRRAALCVRGELPQDCGRQPRRAVTESAACRTISAVLPPGVGSKLPDVPRAVITAASLSSALKMGTATALIAWNPSSSTTGRWLAPRTAPCRDRCPRSPSPRSCSDRTPRRE